MHSLQAMIFCGGLIYAAVDDLKTRTVSDIVCIIIALAGLVTISPASFLGALLCMLPFYLCAGLGLMGGGDWRLAAAVGFVLGFDRVATIVSGKLTGWVDVPAAGENGEIAWPANTELTTDANGKIEVKGLDADTYYLRETQAPAGYNKLADDVTVTIAPTKGTDGTTLTLAPVTTKVNNNAGTLLPSTGGVGTTIFYVVGGVLVLAAIVLLVTKKRMKAEK